MKNKAIKTVLAVVLGFVVFCAAYAVGVINMTDDRFAEARYNIIVMKLTNFIKNEKRINIKNNNDLYGLWKDTNSKYEERYEALIDNDSITLYKYSNDDPTIYWIGTFDTSDFGGGVKTVQSKNFSFVSDLIENAAKSEFKEFTYEDGKIKFISQYNDGYSEITLERCAMNVERLRVVKYPGNRKSYYDENTNYTVNIGDYQISYPSYFDHKEEETQENMIDKWMAPEDYKSIYRMINNNHLVYSPSSTDAHAELFIAEYVNANINDIYEYDENIRENSFVHMNPMNEEIATMKLEGDKDDRITYIFSNRYDDPESGRTIYGMIVETYMLMKETNSSFIISVSYDYDDVSDYDYLADYAKMLKGIKKIN
ncbi:MAG: hypothetical protein IKP66_06335 [Lachnospiraceae bacterium]|nr:hypothetical protein [Lachnospiraceae bacterium]